MSLGSLAPLISPTHVLRMDESMQSAKWQLVSIRNAIFGGGGGSYSRTFYVVGRSVLSIFAWFGREKPKIAVMMGTNWHIAL
jgi:hypothetical protein